jgi:hypothetical protein
MAELEFQQLRDEGLRTETQARQAFDRGDTDVAIQMLADFASKVKGSKLSTAKQSLILNPVERRLDGFRIMKRQVEFYTKEARAKKDHVEGRLAKATAEQQKQDEIASRVRQVQDLLKARDYKKAEELALQTKQLDPENPTLSLVYDLAKQNRRKDDAARIKDEKEIIVREGLNASEKQGPFVDTQDPVAVHIQRSRNALLRGSGDDLHIRTRTPVEREIELKLEKPLTLEFQNAPLRDVIGKFREAASLNIVVDDAALAAEGLEIDKLTVTEKITSPISLRSVMNIMFQKHGLQQIVEDDVVKVTTSKRAKGRLYTKVYSVMDLVTPIPDFALPEHAVISKVIERQMNPQAPWTNSSMAGGPQLTTPNNGLNQGQMVGGGTGAWSGGNFNPAGAAGQLQSTPIPGQAQQHPLGASAHLAPVKSNASEQLKRLITGMVRPYSWQEVGGPGKIDYYDIGGALVVNQTADVIKEITDLLESLRRLQDLSIAVEIRVVSLTEDFYERVGVDFAMNVKTNKNIDFERQLTTGQFRPDPFINSIDGFLRRAGSPRT